MILFLKFFAFKIQFYNEKAGVSEMGDGRWSRGGAPFIFRLTPGTGGTWKKKWRSITKDIGG